MEQGVSPVTNTVNKIVERTKEIIVKVEDPKDPVIITEEKTVLVREADLVSEAINKNKGASVAIYKSVEVVVDPTLTTNESVDIVTETKTENQSASAILTVTDGTPSTETQLIFIARGVVLTGGIVITDSAQIDTDVTTYTIITNSGERIEAKMLELKGELALLQTNIESKATLADISKLDRGQAAIVLSGTKRMRVVKTLIADILTDSGTVVAVDVNASSIAPGGMLIDLDGNLLGISTAKSRENGNSWFTTVNQIEILLHSSDTTDI